LARDIGEFFAQADIRGRDCNVRLVPQAGIQQELFDHLVGAGERRRAERG